MYRTTAAALAIVAQIFGTAAHARDTLIEQPAPLVAPMPGSGLTLPPVALATPDCAATPTAPCVRPIDDAAYRPVEPRTRAFA